METIAGEDKEAHAFPKGISPRMNLILRLEFQLTLSQ